MASVFPCCVIAQAMNHLDLAGVPAFVPHHLRPPQQLVMGGASQQHIPIASQQHIPIAYAVAAAPPSGSIPVAYAVGSRGAYQ